MAAAAGGLEDGQDTLTVRLRFMNGTKSELLACSPTDTAGDLAQIISEDYEHDIARQRWVVNPSTLNFRPLAQPDQPLAAWADKPLEIILLEADPEADSGSDARANEIAFHVVVQGGVHLMVAARDDTIAIVRDQIEAEFNIPATHQRYIVPGVGLVQPDKKPDAQLGPWAGKRIKVMGTPMKDLAAFQSAEEQALRRARARRQARRLARLGGGATAHRTSRPARFRFHEIRALPNLPHPERSQRLLERLAADRGIRLVMEKHSLEVGLLTEMEPLSNTSTTHEGTTRLLGLNHNQGEAIELRLRTDAYDGYRDYGTIRKTLCHELTHNIHGDHDRKFWDLCHRFEREVHLANAAFRTDDADAGPYVPSPEDDVDDHGAVTGGTFVLGGGSAAVGLSRREILAQAAERRRRETSEEGPDGGNQGSNNSDT